jgi:ABC-type bacteriocin/lantibiotic exporter with double-glycine peptidase domain
MMACVRTLPVVLVLAALAAMGGGCGGRTPPPRPPATAANWTVVPGVKMVKAQSEADCGAAALSMVLGRWSPDLDDRAIARALGPPDSINGYRAAMLRNVARSQGMNSFVIEGQITDLVHEVSLGRPVIVGVVITRLGSAYPHYQVVAGADAAGEWFLIADPRGTWTRVPAQELLTGWRPAGQVAVVVFPPEPSQVSSQ